MDKLKWMQKCAWINFCNWMVTPKIWIILGVMTIFSVWNLSGVLDYSAEMGVRVSPWVFPHYFSMPVMLFVYGFLTIALFSDAPFRNPASQFIEIRTGKRLWIQGQCLFILEASFFYTAAYALISLVVILPRIYFTAGWGKLIEKMAYNSSEVHLDGIFFVSRLVGEYAPWKAMAWTVLFVWLVTCFLGVLILACHVVAGGNVGNAAAGFMVFLSYFSLYIGPMLFGNRIYRFTPVSWIYLGMLDVPGRFPDKYYAVSFLVLGIVVFSIVGVRAYEVRGQA